METSPRAAFRFLCAAALGIHFWRPEARVQPAYPLLARMARVEGKVVLKFRVNQDGTTSNIEFESGHPMLRGAVEKAVNSWTFFEDAVGKEIEATIEFIANCPVAPAN